MIRGSLGGIESVLRLGVQGVENGWATDLGSSQQGDPAKGLVHPALMRDDDDGGMGGHNRT